MKSFRQFAESNEVLQADKAVRRFTYKYLAGKFEDKPEATARLKEILQGYFDFFNKVLKRFVAFIKETLPKKGVSPNDFKLLYQTKTTDSIIDKVIEREK